MISNLYSDLLINDRLQRIESLDIAGVYLSLESDSKSKLWLLYMRMYERLWSLPPRSLAKGDYDQRLNQDDQLGARLIRSYAKATPSRPTTVPFRMACPGVKDDELDGTIHPAEDPELPGINLDDVLGQAGSDRVPSRNSGLKTHRSYRDPFEYAEVLKAAGVNLSDREIAAKYYRERAIPYLIPFPAKSTPLATEPTPEGLDVWDIADPIDQID